KSADRRGVMLAFFVFIAQRILAASSKPAERGVRRRLERQGWVHEPTIRVVQLRRAEHHHRDSDGGTPVAWSCQWVVRGHWRQQACGPNFSERRPVFVLP